MHTFGRCQKFEKDTMKVVYQKSLLGTKQHKLSERKLLVYHFEKDNYEYFCDGFE
jgi:hypothetical protein